MSAEFLFAYTKHTNPSIAYNAKALLIMYNLMLSIGEVLEFPQYDYDCSDTELQTLFNNLALQWRTKIINKYNSDENLESLEDKFKYNIAKNVAQFLAELSN